MYCKGKIYPRTEFKEPPEVWDGSACSLEVRGRPRDHPPPHPALRQSPALRATGILFLDGFFALTFHLLGRESATGLCQWLRAYKH